MKEDNYEGEKEEDGGEGGGTTDQTNPNWA